jgi:hypothetical protein
LRRLVLDLTDAGITDIAVLRGVDEPWTDGQDLSDLIEVFSAAT